MAATDSALDLPGRELDTDELRALAERVAADESLWRPLAERPDGNRGYAPLEADGYVGIWVIVWMPGADTGFHDHAGSRGAVAVAAGEIREERPVWGGDAHRIDAHTGESFSFDDTEIHRMTNVTDRPAVTVHVYSRPLERMGMYRVDDEDGRLRRCHVDWDTELTS